MSELIRSRRAKADNSDSISEPFYHGDETVRPQLPYWMRCPGCRRFFKWNYARKYDRMIAPAERLGLTRIRCDKLQEAKGSTLEIGAGTGLNLDCYPADLSGLVLVEPDPYMRRRLLRRLNRTQRSAIVSTGTADDLPAADGEFDTVVTSFVLCSVPNMQDALREITRVLVPGGTYLFLEHVESSDRRVASMQKNAPWAYSCIGCHPDRDISSAIMASELEIEAKDINDCEVPGAPEIERPMIFGTARKPFSTDRQIEPTGANLTHLSTARSMLLVSGNGKR
jgi:SAM-dependent methyltransferase